MDKKTTVEDIIGIIHTDETTNSVEEVKKLRGRTNERFIVDTAGTLIDMETRNTYDYVSEVCPLLNDIDSENAHVKYSLSAYMVDLNNCKGKCSVLEEENEQLKTIRSDLIYELDIVQNELNIAINKGFAPSKSYKNYMASKKTEYDKFWENKIKTHNNRLKELEND